LAAHEREANAELEEKVAHVLDQPALEVPLLRVGAQRQEVEDVRVLQRLLREVGVRGRQRGLEVRERLAGAFVHAGLDLRLKDRAAPAMLDGLPDVPEALGVAVDAIQKPDVVTPGELCNSLLHNLLVRPRLRERAHVLQVPRREALHLWEGGA
jgi:hypothetical protein